MNLFYQGADITDDVVIDSLTVGDHAWKKSDSLEAVFENAGKWYSWGPKKGDLISVTDNGYDSGAMYVSDIFPGDGKFRILASSIPFEARNRGFESFYKQTSGAILNRCAAESGMSAEAYGLSLGLPVTYITRENEGCAAFLARYLEMENAVLKCENGAYKAIGVLYAQERPAAKQIELYSSQRGFEYIREGARYKSVTVETPYASATAWDSDDDATETLILHSLPAMTNAEAGRWARGKLFALNLPSERVVLSSEFQPSFTAMERFDISGDTDAAGEWIVAGVRHDIMNQTSTVTLYRCIDTIV